MTVETITDGEQATPTQVSSLPVSPRRILGFAGGALLAGIVIVVGWNRFSTDRQIGYLHSATESVTAGRQARITNLLVQSGQSVKPGTPLLVLKDASLEAARTNQQNALAALEAELRQSQARAAVEIEDRKAKLQAEIFEAQLKQAGFEEKRFDQRLSLFAAENRVMVAEAEARLSEDQLVAAGDDIVFPFEPLTMSAKSQPKRVQRDLLMDLRERESMRNKLEASEAQVSLCEERLNSLKKQLENVPAQINEAFGVNVIQTRIQSAQLALARLDAEAPTLTVTAKRHGTVGVFNKGRGELIGPMDIVVEIFDPDQPYIMLETDTSQLAKYPAKSTVELLFPCGSVRQGRISELPPQAASLPGPRDPLTASSGRIRLRVQPAGQIWPTVPFGTHIEVRPLGVTQPVRS